MAIYNMDEKGCQLNLHKEPKVLAARGARRVHIVGPEYGENITIVSCGNAIGNVIPPMLLFKGVRFRKAYTTGTPGGTAAEMTLKGSMTIVTFIKWIQHFARYKTQGKVLLIFDGAKCHLDYRIVEEAEKHNIILYCLPSNTTHELQPFDKSVFGPFEDAWDKSLLRYWRKKGENSLCKEEFGQVFTPAWDLATCQANNVKAGFGLGFGDLSSKCKSWVCGMRHIRIQP